MSNIHLPKQQTDKITAEAVKEYLARGGKITVCETGARTENIQMGQWTRNRRRGPKSKSTPDTEEQLTLFTPAWENCSMLSCYSVETVTFPCVMGLAP